MVRIITDALRRVKDDLPRLLRPESIRDICRASRHQRRERVLDPVTTIHLFALQICCQRHFGPIEPGEPPEAGSPETSTR